MPSKSLLLGVSGSVAAAWTPASLAGLVIWLQADKGTFQGSDGTTAATADTDPVGYWADQSGNGNHAIQATNTAYRPLLKTNIQNGKPALRFDGSNDYLKITDNANFKTEVVQCFIVCKSTVNGIAIVGYPHATSHSSPYYRWVLYHGQDNGLQVRIDSDAPGTPETVLSSNVILRYDTSTRDVYRNGTRIYDGAARTVTYPNEVGLYLGSNSAGGEPLNGDILEYLQYNAALSTTDCEKVETYLNTKYAIY